MRHALGHDFEFQLCPSLSLLNRRNVRGYSTPLVTGVQQVFAALASVPFVVAGKTVPNVREAGLLVLLGVLCTVLAHTFFIKSLSRIPVRTAGIILCLEPVYGIIFALLFLHEIPAWRTCLGGAVILAAVAGVMGRESGKYTPVNQLIPYS